MTQAAAWAALISTALLPSRLLGLQGVESALALGLTLPPVVGGICAAAIHRTRSRLEPIALGDALAQTARIPLVAIAVPAVLLALNALRFQQCDPLIGLGFILLMPTIGVLLSALCGLMLGATPLSRRTAIVTAALVPILAALHGLWVFWSSPAIFVFGPFAGWFPGTLYDEALSIPLELLTYRLRTLLWIAALLVVAAASWSSREARLRWEMALQRPWRFVIGVLLIGAAASTARYAEELGHRSSAAFIASELGVTRRSERCVAHFPADLASAEQKRLLDDCETRVVQARGALGLGDGAPVNAFFYRSDSEKKRLMGAGNTFIAKPWRKEVHLQLAGWPHPVLHHEIVHAVAADTAVGPFRVVGSLGGWIPNAGLIEGTAVAIAWDQRDGLTPHERAKVLLSLGKMPALKSVLGIGFLGNSASQSYAVAGSFLRFLRDEQGVSLAKLYRLGDVEAAAGLSLEKLEAKWKRFLEAIPVDPKSVELARMRLEQPSLFSAVCPRKVARLRNQLAQRRHSGDALRAKRCAEELLTIDQGDFTARGIYIGLLAEQNPRRAREELERMRELGATPAQMALAIRELADALWRHDELDAAAALLEELRSLPQGEDDARATEVRRIALRADPKSRDLLRSILVGDSGRGATPPVVVHLAQELSSVRSDGLGAYLEARQLIHADEYQNALPLLRRAETLGLPAERLRHENAWMLGRSLFASGKLDQARELYVSIASDEGRSAADHVEAADWLERIALTHEPIADH